jgi:hypothetical protein
MKWIIIPILSLFLLCSCLFTLSKSDIENPYDTVKTLGWVLNKIKQKDFFSYFEELFTEQGEEIPERMREIAESKENEDKEKWKKIQEMFHKVVIKTDSMTIKKNTAIAQCTYFFPDNYYLKSIEIKMIKDSDGWQIISIKELKKQVLEKPKQKQLQINKND